LFVAFCSGPEAEGSDTPIPGGVIVLIIAIVVIVVMVVVSVILIILLIRWRTNSLKIKRSSSRYGGGVKEVYFNLIFIFCVGIFRCMFLISFFFFFFFKRDDQDDFNVFRSDRRDVASVTVADDASVSSKLRFDMLFFLLCSIFY
jgi:hypothetical protein